MTNKPMLSVERELLERLFRVGLNAVGFGCKTPAEELRALLDNPAPVDDRAGSLVPEELVELLRADLRQEVESARLSLAAKSNQYPAGYEACGELFKTVMGAQNYAGSMPVYPLFKSAPIGIDIESAFEEMRRTIRSREALIDDLRSKISEHQQIAKVLSEDPEKSAEQLFNRLNPGCKWWKMGDDLKNRCRAEQPAPVEFAITYDQILEAMRPEIMSADGGYVFNTAKQDVIDAGRALLAEVSRLNGVKP